MSRKRGFTLVELLVVIAVIALLMAILMPVLSRARKQAKSVICQSNLRQWGLMFAMYTDDNDDCFPTRTRLTGRWIDVLFDYYFREDKIRCCPMAKTPMNDDPTDTSAGVYGETFKAWGKLAPTVGRPQGTWGSYGINHWLYVPGTDPLYSQPARDYWRTVNVRNRDEIPLFLDCRVWCAGPEHTDVIPDIEDASIGSHAGSGMQRFSINRHNQAINAIFLDYSVSNVPLKRLYRLRWSRAFDMHAPEPDWPPWMENFRD